MYGLQRGALTHKEQQAIKGPKITSVNHSNGKINGLIYIKNEKRETRIHYINKRQLLYFRFLT